ncbi:MAG: hypothetical protein HY617_01305 [Candidatus Sungbacteria bacterium]|nr:hypothetical protein [Candidatus Sungbacteria bacterium]
MTLFFGRFCGDICYVSIVTETATDCQIQRGSF